MKSLTKLTAWCKVCYKDGYVPQEQNKRRDTFIPEAIKTDAVLLFLLVTGSSTKPVDYRNIGYGCNLPVGRRRLQRDFNRAVLATKIGFFRKVTNGNLNADVLNTKTTRDFWSEGVLDLESLNFLPCLRSYQPFNRLEVNQLDKDITEVGRSAAGAILTQIAEYSLVLNQSTGSTNEGFIWVFTHRITGSLNLLYQASGLRGDLTLCPCLKKNGQSLSDYTQLIECPSHGFLFYFTIKWKTLCMRVIRMLSEPRVHWGKLSHASMMTNENVRGTFLPLFPPQREFTMRSMKDSMKVANQMARQSTRVTLIENYSESLEREWSLIPIKTGIVYQGEWKRYHFSCLLPST